VNVEDFPDDLNDTATSLRNLLGQPLDRSEIARKLIQRLDFHHARALADGPETLDDPYRSKSEHLGHRVEVSTASGCWEGRLVGLDLRSCLTVESGGDQAVIPGREIISIVNLD
jgi:BirA family biotin operon repressor/biotin-[acetyl-CoA-carboxylase] ligase